MREIFADTFYLLAIFNPSDRAHAQALALAHTLHAPLVTTDWVLTEVADALSDPANRQGCVRLIDDLRGNAGVVVVPASRALHDAGWRLYVDRPDKGWSLTDCISFAVMSERGIHEALTGDRHFAQAGFTLLFKQ